MPEILALLQNLAPVVSRESARLMLCKGNVKQTTMKVTEITRMDLIILSIRHGRTGALRLLPGSVAEKMAYESKTPYC